MWTQEVIVDEDNISVEDRVNNAINSGKRLNYAPTSMDVGIGFSGVQNLVRDNSQD